MNLIMKTAPFPSSSATTFKHSLLLLLLFNLSLFQKASLLLSSFLCHRCLDRKVSRGFPFLQNIDKNRALDTQEFSSQSLNLNLYRLFYSHLLVSSHLIFSLLFKSTTGCTSSVSLLPKDSANDSGSGSKHGDLFYFAPVFYDSKQSKRILDTTIRA